MSTTAVKQVQMFIDGESRPALDGKTVAVVAPATGEQIAEVPAGSAADVDAAVAAADAAFPTWSLTTPGERAKALLKLADRLEGAEEEFAALEAQNVGKPMAPGARGDGDDRRPPALLRRCRPDHGGAGGRRVHARPHQHHPSRPARRGRLRRPLELPAADGDLEDLPGADDRQHAGPEALRAHAADRDPPCRTGRRPLPQGRLQRRHRRRRPGRRRARPPPQGPRCPR